MWEFSSDNDGLQEIGFLEALQQAHENLLLLLFQVLSQEDDPATESRESADLTDTEKNRLRFAAWRLRQQEESDLMNIKIDLQ